MHLPDFANAGLTVGNSLLYHSVLSRHIGINTCGLVGQYIRTNAIQLVHVESICLAVGILFILHMVGDK